MSSETDKKEESKQPGFMKLIEDNSILVDEESGLKQLQDNPQIDSNSYNSQQEFLTIQHSNQSEEQKIVKPKKKKRIEFLCISQSTHFQEIQQIQAKQAELLQMKQRKQFMDVDLEQQNTNRSDNYAKQSNIYFQETDGASGLEMKRLINQEGDQESNQVIFNLPNCHEETFLCQVCYYDIKESRAFDCNTCLATNSHNKICNYCMLGYLKETVKRQLQADEIVIKCPLNTCGKNMNFDQTLNQLLALQSYNAEKKESYYSNFDEGLSFKEAYVQLESVLFERFQFHSNDLKYCPAKDCVYGGYQDKKHCSDKYVGEKCEQSWRDHFKIYNNIKCIDLSNMSNSDKLKMKCRQIRYCLQYFLTQLYLLFFEKTCPNCGIYILKNWGCNVMTCTKCYYSFCWSCKINWFEHDVAFQNYICGTKRLIKLIIIVLCFLFFEFKIIQVAPKVQDFQITLLKTIGTILYADLFIFAYVKIEFMLWKCWDVRGTSQQKRWKYIKLMLLLLFLQFLRHQLSFLIFSTNLLVFMFNIVLIQIGVFALVLLGFGLYKRFINHKNWKTIQQRLIRQREERLKQQNLDYAHLTDLELKIQEQQKEIEEIMIRIQISQREGPEARIKIFNHREAEDRDYQQYKK